MTTVAPGGWKKRIRVGNAPPELKAGGSSGRTSSAAGHCAPGNGTVSLRSGSDCHRLPRLTGIVMRGDPVEAATIWKAPVPFG